MTEFETQVLQDVRHIHAAVDGLRYDMREVKGRLDILENQFASLPNRVERIDGRVERIEHRLKLIEA